MVSKAVDVNTVHYISCKISVSSDEVDLFLNPSWLADIAVYRCDRTELFSVHSRGGGVLLSVRNIYPSEQMFVPNSECLDIVFVKINLIVNIFICCLYVPLASDCSMYARLFVVFKCFLDLYRHRTDDICIYYLW